MKEEKSMPQYLYQTLIQQNEILGNIISQQRFLRTAVTDKNWDYLENAMHAINTLADKFSGLESQRIEICNKLSPETPDDMYAVSRKLPVVFKKPVIEIFHQVRQKLAVSKIENDTLSEYIRIATDFLQGVFDTVLPQRRNTLYSPSGALLKQQPESVVLNTII